MADSPFLWSWLPQSSDSGCPLGDDDAGMSPLRSYLVWLLPPAQERDSHPILHYVVEETRQRAAEVFSQSYPSHRIIGLRDVTDEAAAA
jgi:hypothetical protein